MLLYLNKLDVMLRQQGLTDEERISHLWDAVYYCLGDEWGSDPAIKAEAIAAAKEAEKITGPVQFATAFEGYRYYNKFYREVALKRYIQHWDKFFAKMPEYDYRPPEKETIIIKERPVYRPSPAYDWKLQQMQWDIDNLQFQQEWQQMRQLYFYDLGDFGYQYRDAQGNAHGYIPGIGHY